MSDQSWVVEESNVCMQVAAVTNADDMPAQLRRCFRHEVMVPAPDYVQRRTLVTAMLGGAGKGLSAEALDDAAAQTAGAIPGFPIHSVRQAVIQARLDRPQMRSRQSPFSQYVKFASRALNDAAGAEATMIDRLRNSDLSTHSVVTKQCCSEVPLELGAFAEAAFVTHP